MVFEEQLLALPGSAKHCCSMTNSVLLLIFLKTFQNALQTRGQELESTWLNGVFLFTGLQGLYESKQHFETEKEGPAPYCNALRLS